MTDICDFVINHSLQWTELWLFIHHYWTSVTCFSIHCFNVAHSHILLTGSRTMFKWYLGLNFHESPFFDYRESNQVDVGVMCLCTWIFAVCLFLCRCLADLPKEKRLYLMFHHFLLLNKLVSHLSHLKTQTVRGSKLLLIHRLTQAFLKMLLP